MKIYLRLTQMNPYLFSAREERTWDRQTKSTEWRPPTSLSSRYSQLVPHLSTVNRMLTFVYPYDEADGCYSYEHFCTTSPKEIWRKIPYNLRRMKNSVGVKRSC